MNARIDVHNHLIPPRYQARLDELGLTAGGIPAPAWSEDLALAAMDAHAVETAVVSVSTPGVHLGDDARAGELVRHVNEYAADLVARRPARFGFFASVPLPDVDGAIAEAQYCLDELDADGLVLLANIGGRYLGDPLFDPLLAELNRRRTTVFVHPSTLPGVPVDGIPPYIADFLLDTTRAVVSLVRGNAVRRYPDITFILSHGGGFVPFAAHRLAMTMTLDSDRKVEDILADLASFHVDTAQAGSRTAIPAMLDFFGAGNVHFGTDWPHASDRGASYHTGTFNALDLDANVRQAIESGSTRALLPRLLARGAALRS